MCRQPTSRTSCPSTSRQVAPGVCSVLRGSPGFSGSTRGAEPEGTRPNLEEPEEPGRTRQNLERTLENPVEPGIIPHEPCAPDAADAACRQNRVILREDPWLLAEPGARKLAG